MTTLTKPSHAVITYVNADHPTDVQLHRTPYDPPEGRVVWLITMPDDLMRMPMTVLLAAYNRATGKAIKSFNTRAKGAVQTYAALRGWLDLDLPDVPAVPSSPEPTETSPMKTKTTKTKRATTSKKNTASGRPGRRSKFTPESTITLVAKENPKRPGSAAHTRFAFYRTGQTVQQFLDKGGWLADIRWDEKMGFIRVSGAKK
jgi:hypothetical protein